MSAASESPARLRISCKTVWLEKLSDVGRLSKPAGSVGRSRSLFKSAVAKDSAWLDWIFCNLLTSANSSGEGTPVFLKVCCNASKSEAEHPLAFSSHDLRGPSLPHLEDSSLQSPQCPRAHFVLELRQCLGCGSQVLQGNSTSSFSSFTHKACTVGACSNVIVPRVMDSFQSCDQKGKSLKAPLT